MYYLGITRTEWEAATGGDDPTRNGQGCRYLYYNFTNSFTPERGFTVKGINQTADLGADRFSVPTYRDGSARAAVLRNAATSSRLHIHEL